jgi:hypothetical protein
MIRLECKTHKQFNLALSEIFETIVQCGGWIKDHHVYSNKMATISFEIPRRRTESLVAMLKKIEILIYEKKEDLEESVEDVPGIVNVTFIHHDPDQIRPVPAFG